MELLFASLTLLILTGILALIAGRRERLAGVIAVLGLFGAAALAAKPVYLALFGGLPLAFAAPWSMPLGSFSVRLDAVSALFITAILLLAPIAGFYGIEYLKPYAAKKNVGRTWFFYNVLVASMMLVCLASNALLFLLAWESMAVSSFFLVAFENERPEVRAASWTYLVATHIGTAFLLPMFILLCGPSPILDFPSASGMVDPAIANVCFIFALIGFGTKAGLMPFHIWLPEAHPAAPSHVSALMSGVMIKTGLYGIIRVLMLVESPPAWWGWTLVGIGALSAVLGVLFAVAQHDLKRLLAYSSIENVGIITMGIGVGVVGCATGNPFVAALGFGGALLHVINHAIFKGLLFLGAGAIVHATHTREIDQLGGLLKKMPVTAATFLIGAVAVCGLPPLNGFLSELLIYIASFSGITQGTMGMVVPFLAVIAGLALAGGLATACFTKAFGIPFLGAPRSEATLRAHECGAFMRIPLIVLAALCVLIGASGPAMMNVLIAPVATIIGPDNLGGFTAVNSTLAIVCLVLLVLTLVVSLLIIVRKIALNGREVRESETWGCGYLAPTSRMQYTASSFAQPVTDLFKGILLTRRTGGQIRGFFPAQADLETHTPDVGHERLYRPLFGWAGKVLGKFAVVQHGKTQLYVLYIVIALAVLMVWKLQ